MRCRPHHFHKYGALSAARDINPEFASHPTQFFLVRGTNYNIKDLQPLQMEISILGAQLEQLVLVLQLSALKLVLLGEIKMARVQQSVK